MKVIVALLVVAALIVGLLFMQGTFDKTKVGPETAVKAPESAGAVSTVLVEEVTVPVVSEAVGTVRSRRSTRVSPRIMGTLLEVTVAVGDRVEEGKLLARIDDREVRARVAAMKAGLSQAEARYAQAAAAHRRYTDLYARSATTKEQLESVTGDYEIAKAAVEGAKEAVNSAEIVVGYTEIHAQLGGVVSEKLAEPGDLALPGKPILVIQDPADLRLEADVREYLIPHLPVGAPVTVAFGKPIDRSYETKVEERAPEADPGTRTFRVKAPIPTDSAARPGNFGRLLFQTGEATALLVPAAVVRRIGQLETVKVVDGDRIVTRHVRTGKAHGDRVEVLSGLSQGEKVVSAQLEGR